MLVVVLSCLMSSLSILLEAQDAPRGWKGLMWRPNYQICLRETADTKAQLWRVLQWMIHCAHACLPCCCHLQTSVQGLTKGLTKRSLRLQVLSPMLPLSRAQPAVPPIVARHEPELYSDSGVTMAMGRRAVHCAHACLPCCCHLQTSVQRLDERPN